MDDKAPPTQTSVQTPIGENVVPALFQSRSDSPAASPKTWAAGRRDSGNRAAELHRKDDSKPGPGDWPWPAVVDPTHRGHPRGRPCGAPLAARSLEISGDIWGWRQSGNLMPYISYTYPIQMEKAI